MASAVRRYGTKHIVQMRKLTLFYSPKGGSSKGCREFINKNFVQFASERPSSVFTATTIPDTRHPHFLVEFCESCCQTNATKFILWLLNIVPDNFRYRVHSVYVYWWKCSMFITVNGRGYKVDLKNLSDKEVLDHALVLSTSSGKKPKKLQQVLVSSMIHLNFDCDQFCLFWLNASWVLRTSSNMK